MSIKRVDSIPEPAEKISQRQHIRNDFEEAYRNGISAFEFDGDYYNYEHLAGYAREELRDLFRRKVYNPAVRDVREMLRKELETTHIWCEQYWNYYDRIGKIRQRQEDDRIHVYAEIDYKFLETFKETLLNDTRKLMAKKDEKKQVREP